MGGTEHAAGRALSFANGKLPLPKVLSTGFCTYVTD